MAEFLDKLAVGLERVSEQGGLAGGSAWVVAVSGGADSVALLVGLLRLRETGRANIGRIHGAHLEHGLRGPAGEADARWVEELCGRMGVEVTIGRADVEAAASASGESIESEARRQRYAFLHRAACEVGSAVVVVGHTADDQVETIVHRIVRGTGIRGLAGMPAARLLGKSAGGEGQEVWLVRPMLEVRRHEVEAFLRSEGIVWREDLSNASLAYTRNRIRHELMGVLRTFNPEVERAILRLAGTAGWVNELITHEAQELVTSLTRETGPGELRLDARRLRQHSRLEQAEVVRAALRRLDTPERRLGHKHIVRVLDVLGPDGPVGVELPAGVRVRRSGGRLIFTRSVG